MIYVDTSVVLAELLAEDRQPPEAFWSETLVSSRLLEYEVWVRVHARQLARTHGDAARALVGRVALLELVSPVLARVLERFPKPVRTLDTLHLASTEFLRERQPDIRLATYDARQAVDALTLLSRDQRLGRDCRERRKRGGRAAASRRSRAAGIWTASWVGSSGALRTRSTSSAAWEPGPVLSTPATRESSTRMGQGASAVHLPVWRAGLPTRSSATCIQGNLRRSGGGG